MSTAVATTQGGVPAPLTTAADGLMYEQAINFLGVQASRAQELAGLAEQIHALQQQLQAAAALMAADHEQAQAALARFNIQAPNIGPSIEMLMRVAGNPAPMQDLMTAFMALEAVTSGCLGDRENLRNRFGTAWEIMRGENADGAFLNG